MTPVESAPESAPFTLDMPALTAREYELAGFVAEAMINKSIAYAMGISEGTVKVYLSRLYGKLAIPSQQHQKVALALLFVGGKLRQSSKRPWTEEQKAAARANLLARLQAPTVTRVPTRMPEAPSYIDVRRESSFPR